MHYAEFKRGYILRLDRGEEIQMAIQKFAKKKQILSASYHGIGALTLVDLGYYNIKTNEYKRKHFKGEYELLSLSGNLSYLKDQAFPHSHVILSDQKFKTIGGHLFSGIISVTAEIYMYTTEILLERDDSTINFKPLKLSKSL